MASFSACVDYAVKTMHLPFSLKKEQLDILDGLYNGRDTIAVLPTGFGKSVIFQLLPCLMQVKYGKLCPMIAIVISPLNSIMEDQVHNLRNEKVKAGFVSYDGRSCTTFEEDEDDGNESDDSEVEGEKQSGIILPKTVTMESLQKGDFNLIYMHPEAVLTRELRALIRSRCYQERVCAIVVDEVHIVTEWGEEFRPAFKQLGNLTCIFPSAAHVALTATCTDAKLKDLSTVLQYNNVKIVKSNPDRPNIFIDKHVRPPNINKYRKFDELIQPIGSQLKEMQGSFPVTIIYMESLEALGYCYQFLNSILKEHQYEGEHIPENRIFAQYHKDYTPAMKTHIVKELSKDDPKLRLVLATVALGMGLNAPAVEQIVHARPPTSLEAYMQEIGRAGRIGQPAKAVLYYNNSDIAKSRKGLADSIIQFCRNHTTCLRLQLVQHFGFDSVCYTGAKALCCANCKLTELD